jgi:predicted XRE-type DNA-binding protein
MLDKDEAWDQRLGCTVKEFGQQAAGLQDLVEQMNQLIRTAQLSQRRAQ